jgi:hypothetical protein
MAKRKPTRKKRRPPKKRKKTTLKNSLTKAFAGLAILAVLVVAIGFIVYYLAPPEKPSPDVSVSKSTQAGEKPLKKKPQFEIFPKEKTPAREPQAKIDIPKSIPRPKPLPSEKLPRVALIIDDLGYDKKMAKKFLGLGLNLTFSILPHSPFQNKISR